VGSHPKVGLVQQAFIPHAENARGINTTRLGIKENRSHESKSIIRLGRYNNMDITVGGAFGHRLGYGQKHEI
ncbi:MAG: hypothetical protein AB2826_22565, partial [Candidatus Thiodiazotropha sp.]